MYFRSKNRDEVGLLPTQMTSEFHPLSQIQRSAVTTKTGCQGDPLCLLIEGTPCEDYSDLDDEQCASAVGTLASACGQNKSRRMKKKQTAQSDRFQWGDGTLGEIAFVGRNIEVTYGLG